MRDGASEHRAEEPHRRRDASFAAVSSRIPQQEEDVGDRENLWWALGLWNQDRRAGDSNFLVSTRRVEAEVEIWDWRETDLPWENKRWR